MRSPFSDANVIAILTARELDSTLLVTMFATVRTRLESGDPASHPPAGWRRVR